MDTFPAESPDTAMGLVFDQATLAGVDDRVARLSLGAVESRFDGLIARARIEALELDGNTVNASVSRASADSIAFEYGNYRRAVDGKVFRDAPLGRRKPLGPFVNHA
jgi:hypothetical protein